MRRLGPVLRRLLRRPRAVQPRGAPAGRRGAGRFELRRGGAPAPRRTLRVPWRRLFTTALLVAVLAGAGWGGARLLLGDALRVRDVTVVGAQVTDPFAVAAAARVAGASMLTLDAGAVARRVAALPEVSSVRVHRAWPRGIVIDIREHEGWGYWQRGDVRRVVDIQGRVRERSRPPAAGAPTIIEIGLPPASAADLEPDPDSVLLVDRLLGDGALDAMGVRPTGFVFQRDRGLTVRVEGGPSVLFGDSQNYEFKLATWAALLERTAEQGLAVREIDLRFGRHVVMR